MPARSVTSAEHPDANEPGAARAPDDGRSRAPSRRGRQRLLVTLLAPLAVVAALELGLRAAGFEQAVAPVPFEVWNRNLDEAMRLGRDVHRFDAATLWSPRPGARLFQGVAGDTINAEGWRGPPLPAEPGPDVLRVAFVGESALFGVGVRWGETAAALLPGLAAEQGRRVEVLNASVVGYTVAQGLARYRALVAARRPDVVVIACGTINEALPTGGLSDVEKLEHVRRVTTGWRRALHALRAASRTVQALDRLGVELRGGEEAERERRLAAHREEQQRQQGFERPDWPGRRRVAPEVFTLLLDEFVGAVSADGALPVLCRMPIDPDVAAAYPAVAPYGEAIGRIAAARDVPFVDLAEAVDDALRAGRDPGTLFLDSDAWHLGPRGQWLLAHELAGVLRDVEPAFGGR